MSKDMTVSCVNANNEVIENDYSNYSLNPAEFLTGFLVGLVAGIAAVYIMFGSLVAGVVVGLFTGVAGVLAYRKHLCIKRKKAMLIQFRDMLDSLSNSFSAGKNTIGAFSDAYTDLKLTYGENTPIVNELMIILTGLYNNFTIEDLLKNMAGRCDIDDISNFAETFLVCNRLGGNLKKIVSESKAIITDKIEIEMEIQTTIASNKNEINILCIMPFVIVSLMRLMGVDAATDNNYVNVVVKIIAIVMFVAAFIIGRKIADIKV